MLNGFFMSFPPKPRPQEAVCFVENHFGYSGLKETTFFLTLAR